MFVFVDSREDGDDSAVMKMMMMWRAWLIASFVDWVIFTHTYTQWWVNHCSMLTQCLPAWPPAVEGRPLRAGWCTLPRRNFKGRQIQRRDKCVFRMLHWTGECLLRFPRHPSWPGRGGKVWRGEESGNWGVAPLVVGDGCPCWHVFVYLSVSFCCLYSVSGDISSRERLTMLIVQQLFY